MKQISFILFLLIVLGSCETPDREKEIFVKYAQNDMTEDSPENCGIQPITSMGCKVRCINGNWIQVCATDPSEKCGLRLIPHIGCTVACINGSWKETCD